MKMSYKSLAVLLLTLLLNACGGSFDVGDKVIVATDYDEVRSGYIVGKFVKSKGDKTTVEIRKFKNLPGQFHEGIDKGDEEEYPSSQVYSYEDGRAIVNARKKFFKEIDRLSSEMSPSSQMSEMVKSLLQSVIGGDSTGAMSLAKSFMKGVKKKTRKVKLNEDKLDSLRELAKAGKLKEWKAALPLLKVAIEAKNSQANSLDDIYDAMHASMKDMGEGVNDLAEVYKTMPYIDDASGASRLGSFVDITYAYTYMLYQGDVIAWTKKNKVKNTDAKSIRHFLDVQKDNVVVSMNMMLSVLKLKNIYKGGDLDDQIGTIQDKLETIKEDHSLYDVAAKSYIRQQLSDMKAFKQPMKDRLKQLRDDLSTLGSSEENLEIDLNDLLEQAYGAYGVTKALTKDHWLGKWKFSQYGRHFSKNVHLSKMDFSVQTSANLDKVTFSGQSGLSLSDAGGKNSQKFDATFEISDDASFLFSANIRGGSGLKCSFMESQEIECIGSRASSSLTLYTREQRAALKAKAKAEKKAKKEAAKAAAAQAKEKKAIHSAPASAPEDVIVPEPTSSTTEDTLTTAAASSWGKPDTPAWQVDKPKTAAPAKAPASKPRKSENPVQAQAHRRVQTQAQTTVHHVAPVHTPSPRHASSVHAVASSRHHASPHHASRTHAAAPRAHARSRLSQADSRMLDQGINRLRALL